MKVKLEVELQELDWIFKGLKVIDQFNIFTAPLKNKIAVAAKPVVDNKENENDTAPKKD
jgi:hypothetical protein